MRRTPPMRLRGYHSRQLPMRMKATLPPPAHRPPRPTSQSMCCPTTTASKPQTTPHPPRGQHPTRLPKRQPVPPARGLRPQRPRTRASKTTRTPKPPNRIHRFRRNPATKAGQTQPSQRTPAATAHWTPPSRPTTDWNPRHRTPKHSQASPTAPAPPSRSTPRPPARPPRALSPTRRPAPARRPLPRSLPPP